MAVHTASATRIIRKVQLFASPPARARAPRARDRGAHLKLGSL
jgi:hypothetical protein